MLRKLDLRSESDKNTIFFDKKQQNMPKRYMGLLRNRGSLF